MLNLFIFRLSHFITKGQNLGNKTLGESSPLLWKTMASDLELLSIIVRSTLHCIANHPSSCFKLLSAKKKNRTTSSVMNRFSSGGCALRSWKWNQREAVSRNKPVGSQHLLKQCLTTCQEYDTAVLQFVITTQIPMCERDILSFYEGFM